MSILVVILVNNEYIKQSKYWLASAGLGIMLWEGVYEGQEGVWLRWRNRIGNLILTGAERAEDERQQKELAVKKAERA